MQLDMKAYEEEALKEEQQRTIRDARIDYLLKKVARLRIINAFLVLIAVVAVAWAISMPYQIERQSKLEAGYLASSLNYTPEYAPYTAEATAKSARKPAKKHYHRTYKVTYYCACKKCCGKSDGITASGKNVKEGRTIAVNGLKFGTKIKIPGVGMRTVEDRVGRNGVIDVYVNSHSKALKLGTKTVKVAIYR